MEVLGCLGVPAAPAASLTEGNAFMKYVFKNVCCNFVVIQYLSAFEKIFAQFESGKSL